MMRSNTLTDSVDEYKDLDSSSLLPDGWQMFVHPQGSIYFSDGRIVVDQDIRNPGLLSVVLHSALDIGINDWEEDLEVQMHVGNSGDCTNFALYINHTHCIAAHKYENADSHAFSVMDPATLNRRRRLYWNYLWAHSAHIPCPVRAVPDACDALAWFYADNLISGAQCVVPFSKDECEELLRRIKEFESPCYDKSPAKVAFLAWLLREICSFRDAEMYGQLPRKELGQRLRNKFTRPKVALPAATALPFVHLIMNVVFFGIPYSYMRLVKQSFEYRGRLAGMQANWEKYIGRLVREYSDFLLISTVLLSATVGLLSVPNISRFVELAALVSAFSSLGSIIVGVFAIWQHQAKYRAIDSFTYMRNVQHNMLGFHGHAMLLSLPPVLLVHDTAGRVVVGVILVIFLSILGTVIAALYTLTRIWSYGHSDSWFTRFRRLLGRSFSSWRCGSKRSCIA
ncbi:hypothetical protein BDP27DRAFT_1314825 [Rhodocollybia butyracea]|uniref:Uncharacterized protein n=1 Tax=Rhodocollybia butyracea TaxID=206335 RepID=A0A9P5UE87_9AGAR|nr:hypothetical protein BDP27DRAFT_1314825 [Rhodocollybia butyracea]